MLKPPADPPKPRLLAPAWVALLSAWLGLACLVSSAVIPFLPGASHPRAELTHERPFSPADKVILIPVYLSPSAIFLGIIVLWQMRGQSRPLPDALLAQRIQSYTGITLGILGAAVIYVFVHFQGPGA